MKFLKIITCFIISLNTYAAFAQSYSNDAYATEISAFYNALQHNFITAEALNNLTPNFKLQVTNQTLDKPNRYTITIEEIMQNNWTQIGVSNLKMETTKNNLILVTGNLSGRQPTECDFITTPFKHVWELKVDKNNVKLTKQ